LELFFALLLVNASCRDSSHAFERVDLEYVFLAMLPNCVLHRLKVAFDARDAECSRTH
jgi:hypothetical protein